MRLSNCYHPKLVFNKYSKEFVIARCGKCPACLNARAASWVQRLDMEMSQHKYTFFSTFQYDELHVNQLVLLRSEDNPNKLPSYIDGDSGEIISLSDLRNVVITPADIKYCLDTKVLLIPNVTDFQKFLKRLRKKLVTLYGKNARIRYFCAFEIGPTTHRPHMHSLFFIDSDEVAKDLARLLSDTWQYGNTYDPHPVSGSASSYVATYVNCTASLPKIFLHPRIRQKALFSKCPPIGTYQWTKDTFKEFFNSQTPFFTIYRKELHKFCDVPFWRFIQCRLFPRITAFNRLSHYDRTILYRKGYCTAYRQKWLKGIISHLSIPYWLPYFQTAFYTPNQVGYMVFNKDSLLRFISSIVRACDNAREYGLTIEDYVFKIEQFYEEKQKSDIKEFYNLQDDYFKEHPLRDMLIIYPNIYILTKGKTFYSLPKWLQIVVSTYWSDHPEVLDYKLSDAFSYRELVGLHDKIYFDNTKQKKSNDYLLSHRDKFNNIITYNQTIKNYEQSEIIQYD